MSRLKELDPGSWFYYAGSLYTTVQPVQFVRLEYSPPFTINSTGYVPVLQLLTGRLFYFDGEISVEVLKGAKDA